MLDDEVVGDKLVEVLDVVVASVVEVDKLEVVLAEVPDVVMLASVVDVVVLDVDEVGV